MNNVAAGKVSQISDKVSLFLRNSTAEVLASAQRGHCKAVGQLYGMQGRRDPLKGPRAFRLRRAGSVSPW